MALAKKIEKIPSATVPQLRAATKDELIWHISRLEAELIRANLEHKKRYGTVRSKVVLDSI